MKLGLTNVDGDFYKVVEVNTIEQLIVLMEKYKNPIILEYNYLYNTDYLDEDVPQKYKDCRYTFEVYDDYRE